MKFVQTHWLKDFPIENIEVMVRDERVYDVNGTNLGSADDLKSQGLEPIKEVLYFYMIRKINTQSYFGSWVYMWLDMKLGHKWWHDDGLKEATRLCEYLRSCSEHWDCELVTFKYEEMKHVDS